MVVKYHFPKKIEKISNPDAVFSQDGKTAIIEYSGSIFSKPTNEFSVEITTEKYNTGCNLSGRYSFTYLFFGIEYG